MRIIGLEEHFWYRPLSDRTEIAQMWLKMKIPACEKLGDIGAGRIADMDRAGVDYQVLSHFDPGAQELDSAADAVALAREANDVLGEAVKAHPTRLGGFATLPTQDVKASVAELERTIKTYGFKGALINGHTHGRYLDEEEFWPILECAESLDVPVYLHPTTPAAGVMDAYYKNYLEEGMHLASWGFAVETGTHVLKMIYKGVFDRFPKLTMILGHMGELLPYNLQRLDRYYLPQAWFRDDSMPPPKRNIQRKPSEYIREQFYITTSGNFSYPSLLCAMLEMGADRIMFSVDYPMDSNEIGVDFLRSAAISETDRNKIAHGNAERLLKIPS